RLQRLGGKPWRKPLFGHKVAEHSLCPGFAERVRLTRIRTNVFESLHSERAGPSADFRHELSIVRIVEAPRALSRADGVDLTGSVRARQRIAQIPDLELRFIASRIQIAVEHENAETLFFMQRRAIFACDLLRGQNFLNDGVRS